MPRVSDPAHGEPKAAWRDGISGLVDPGRALRAREVSRPTAEDTARAEQVLARLLARARGRR